MIATHIVFRPCCFALLLVLSVSGWAQNARLEALRESEEARQRVEAKIREDDIANRKRAEILANNAGKNTNAAPTSVPLVKTENELPPHEKKLLAADAQQLQKYERFLRQSGTGLCKLLNIDETRLAINDIKTDHAFPHLVGLGAYFSFAKQTHNPDEWAQIRLKDGALYPAYIEMKRTTLASSGGMAQSFVYTSGYSLALFITLGNIALDDITRQHPALRFLVELQPPTQYQDFINQVKQFRAGITLGQQRFQSSISARAETTYAMRAINYKKADVIIAFRILQQDADGSLHILWKQLQSVPPIELKGKPAKP